MWEVCVTVFDASGRTWKATVFISVVALALVGVLARVNAAGLDEGWCLGGSSMSKGEKSTYTREFSAGVTYEISASGDRDVIDLDLRIMDDDGKVVAEDTDSSKDASVTFRPKRTGQYTIELHLADARERSLCYFLVETPGRGWNVPERDIDMALRRMAAASTACGAAGFDPLPARFFGFVMERGDKRSMTMNGIRKGEYVVIAVGDNAADDLDLNVSQRGRLLRQDTDDDANPVCNVNAEAGSLAAEVSYISGSGPALVVMALYEKPSRSRDL